MDGQDRQLFLEILRETCERRMAVAARMSIGVTNISDMAKFKESVKLVFIMNPPKQKKPYSQNFPGFLRGPGREEEEESFRNRVDSQLSNSPAGSPATSQKEAV